jgi:2-haloacid dehalogenase
MSRILVFDVNETLLDISAMAPLFADAFGDADAVREWFSTLLLYSQVATLAGPYEDFAAIGGAALDMVAESGGRAAILNAMRELPPHADAAPALARLAGAGFRMVALTNSPPATAEAQLQRAGLIEFLERTFSVDAVRRFKPSPEPYRYVADTLGVPPSALRMIAAHAWDVAGALGAGCAAAFVARPGKVLYPLGPQPDIVGRDLNAVANRIITVDVP